MIINEHILQSLEVGQVKRFADPNGRKGNKNIWALRIDKDVYKIGNWATGESKIVNGSGGISKVKFDKEQFEKNKLEEEIKFREASRQCQQEWDVIPDLVLENEYLKNKNVGAYGVKTKGNVLVIPVYGWHGAIQSLQYILPNGFKQFKSGAKMQGGFHVLRVGTDKDRFIFAEGYATAASIVENTDNSSTVVCTFNCNNIEPVVSEFRKQNINAEFEIWSDVDKKGLSIAHEVALMYQCSVVAPELTDSQIEQGLTDWNDYYNIKSENKEPSVIKTGLIGKIVSFINETNPNDLQPMMALNNTLCFLGALMGRKYATETDLRTNISIISLAGSGVGKDHSRKAISYLADKCDVSKYIGGNSFTSGVAIAQSLISTPSRLFQMDEFGEELSKITSSKASNNEKEIIKVLLELYSSANTIYRGKEYANKKDNPTLTVKYPNLCIYGTSVADNFYESLSSMNALEGTIPRFIITHTPDVTRETIQWGAGRPMSSINLFDIKSSIDAIVNSAGKLAEVADSNFEITPKIAGISDTAREDWNELRLEYKFKSCNSVERAIYNRVCENIMKIALVYAVSENHKEPFITDEIYLWSKRYVTYHANMLVERVIEDVSDSESERVVKSILKLIRVGRGMFLSDLTKKLQKITPRDRSDAIQTLVDSEMIQLVKKFKRGSQKPSTYVSRIS